MERELDDLLAGLPAVLIEGPKAVGKTETAKQRAASRYSLDVERDYEIARGDPEHVLDAPPPVLIDEWQHLPDIWSRVRHRVDSGVPPGTYILTGSAHSLNRASHSGAGRIVSVRMRPMSIAERNDGVATVSLGGLLDGPGLDGAGGRPRLQGQTDWRLENYVEAILESGFPGIRGLAPRLRDRQLDGYLERVVDRDVEVEFGRRLRSAPALKRWMRAYADATATTTTFEKISAAAEPEVGDRPSQGLVRSYREALEALWVLDPLPAWRPSQVKISRLAKAPKHHFADPGLAARLLDLDSGSFLGARLGALFESLVALSVRVYAQAAEAKGVGHLQLRAPDDRELDLVVERRDGKFLAIEVKLTATPHDSDVRHLKWAQDRFGDSLIDALVITTGDTAYRRGDGIGVVPAALLGP